MKLESIFDRFIKSHRLKIYIDYHTSPPLNALSTWEKSNSLGKIQFSFRLTHLPLAGIGMEKEWN